MVQAVFTHGGTVDMYLGDGLMATFGTPHPSPEDAGQALACAAAMVAAMAEWNTLRAQRGEAALAIGVGVHHGPVVLGDIGDERQLEFAVVGATVNLASRLQEMTRALDTTVIASAATLAEDHSGRARTLYRDIGAHRLRGFGDPIELWALG